MRAAPAWIWCADLGVPQKRLEGDEYYEMVDEFMEAVTDRWPNVVVQ